MTILGPILMAALFIAPIILGQIESGSTKKIRVIDDSGHLRGKFIDSESIKFVYEWGNLNQAQDEFDDSDYYAILHIPDDGSGTYPEFGVLYSNKQPAINLLNKIKRPWKDDVEKHKLMANGIDQNILKSIHTSININTVKWDDEGNAEESYTEVIMFVGLFLAILIYFFIFMFGAQVMRGVLEEKTSRIVEVIISSVKPFQLMMGKIIGIALVGLTQFTLWIVLTGGIYGIFATIYADDLQSKNITEMAVQQQSMMPTDTAAVENAFKDNPEIEKAFEMFHSINFGAILFGFFFYFIFGYLMYASLFAAVGAAADNDTDTQQFMLPITIPLILAIVSVQFVIMNPESALSYWLSIIPLTSPIIMLVRIAFGVPFIDLAISMGLLIVSIIGTTWLAAKIYRTGILMYGKKVSYKELWKWIRY
jgi:ABC-2 type transport system permease protein